MAVAVSASNWSLYEKGVFDDGSDAIVNHAVLLVGYGVDEATGEKYYKIRNSWGPKFGEDGESVFSYLEATVIQSFLTSKCFHVLLLCLGYIRIKRTDDDDHLCKMDDQPLVGLGCALDDIGNKVVVKPDKVCGTSAVLFDVSYPVGVHFLDKLGEPGRPK